MQRLQLYGAVAKNWRYLMIPTRQSIVVRVFLSAILAVPLASSVAANAAETSGAPSTIVAKQGGIVITLADVDTFAQTIPPEQRPGFFDNPTRLEDLITTLLLKKQLAKEARELGLESSPEVVAQVAAATDGALSNARMQKFKQDLKYPDFSALAKEDFIGHKEKYILPPKIDVKHVLISIKTHTKDEAKAMAESVQKDAVAKPAEFDALIEKFSEDPSKPTNHGLMPDAGTDRYVRAFSDAAKELKKPGEISPVVESPFGYHVLQLVSMTPTAQPKFEDVKPKIVAKMQADYLEKKVREYTDTIRNLPIDATPELIESLRTRFGGTAAAPAVPGATTP
jgi:peptidyl-prolyl cis-trans isomerase C